MFSFRFSRFLALTSFFFLFQRSFVFADTASVQLSFLSTSSTLTVTAPGSTVSFSSGTASASNSTVTATITGVAVNDARGTQAGWTVSSTSTNLGITGATLEDTANNLVSLSSCSGVTVTSTTLSGTYNGANPQSGYSGTGTKQSGVYQLTVNTVASNLPATVTLVEPDGDSTTPTVTAGAFTKDGLTMTFGSNASWAANCVVRYRVDAFPYTSLTSDVSNLVSDAGDTSSMTYGSNIPYAGTTPVSDSHTHVLAGTGFGGGLYIFNLPLSQVLHSYPIVGSYQMVITLSVT